METIPPADHRSIPYTRRETSLFFQAQAISQYRLMAEIRKSGRLDYDLARAVQGLDDMKLPLVGLGAPTVIAPRRNCLPGPSVQCSHLDRLILAVGVMVGFIVKNLKKLPATRE